MNKGKKALLPALFAATVVCSAGALLSANGIVAQAENKSNMQITLTDGIVVKYYATLEAGTESATAVFDSEVNSLDATVEGKKTESGEWEFVYTKVTPQYVDQTFSVTVGDQTLLSDYSVLTYCNGVIAKVDATDQEKTVARDLIYYGQAAKAYRLGGEVTAEPATAFAGTDNMSLSGSCTEGNKIKSATVVFDTLPALRFYLEKSSATAVVKVDDVDVTAQLVEKDGVYSYTLTGIYATQFDTQHKVELIDGENTQTLLYSVNDYAARMQTNDNVKMQTLAKALWCYGAGADALLNEQNKYIVVTEPTYTETGLARNGKGDEVTLPVLNATNYTYAQTAPDGSAYDYKNADGGKATFTHAGTGIVIEKTITPDTITFNWTDFNCVDIHFKGKPSGMTAAYEDGTYVLTLSKDVEIENMQKLTSTLPSVKLAGEGATLTVPSGWFSGLNRFTLDGASLSAPSSASAHWVVESGELSFTDSLKKALTLNGGTVSVNGNVSTSYLYVEENATLNVTHTSGDSFVIAAGGSAEINGNVNVTKTEGGGTAFNLMSSTDENGVTYYSKMKIGANARIILKSSYQCVFGAWGAHVAYLFLPATAARNDSDKTVKVGENTILQWTEGGFFWWENITYGDYQTLTAPTLESEGKAVSFDKGEIALPKLNTTDYDVSVSGTTMSFTHKQYGAGASLSIADASNLQIGDLTVDYDSTTSTYTYTVAEGKEVTLNGKISATNLVIAGQGTLKVEGSGTDTGVVVATETLRVETGATLKVKSTTGDAIHLDPNAKAYLYGIVDVTSPDNVTGIWCGGKSEIYLATTSRIKTTGGRTACYDGTNKFTIYAPAGVTKAGNLIGYTNEANEWVTLFDSIGYWNLTGENVTVIE